MLRTIRIGKNTIVQGRFEKTLKNGMMSIRVGNKSIIGRPIESSLQRPKTLKPTA